MMITDEQWKKMTNDVFSIFLPSSEIVEKIEVSWYNGEVKEFNTSGELMAYLYTLQDYVDYDIFQIIKMNFKLKDEEKHKKDIDYLVQQVIKNIGG